MDVHDNGNGPALLVFVSYGGDDDGVCDMIRRPVHVQCIHSLADSWSRLRTAAEMMIGFP